MHLPVSVLELSATNQCVSSPPVSSGMGNADLLDTILDLGFQLLLGPQKPLPYLISHTTSFQQGVQRLFPSPDMDDAVDVLGAAGEKCGAE